MCGTLSAASGRAYGMWSWCVYVYVGVKQKGGAAWACKAGGLGARAVPTPVVRGKVIPRGWRAAYHVADDLY